MGATTLRLFAVFSRVWLDQGRSRSIAPTGRFYDHNQDTRAGAATPRPSSLFAATPRPFIYLIDKQGRLRRYI